MRPFARSSATSCCGGAMCGAFAAIPLPRERIDALIEIATPRAVGRPQPALALRAGRFARAAAGRREELHRRQRDAPWRATAGEKQATYAGLKLAGLKEAPVHLAVLLRRRHPYRQRAWPADHARDAALFRGRRDPDAVAGGARRWHRHGLGVDPRSGRGHQGARRAEVVEPRRLSLPRACPPRSISIPSSSGTTGNSAPISRTSCSHARSPCSSGPRALPAWHS